MSTVEEVINRMGPMTHYVEIRRIDGDSCVKRMGPMAESKADKVERGVNINLNHDHYYTYSHNDSDGLMPVED